MDIIEYNGKRLSPAVINGKDLCDEFDFIGMNGSVLYKDVNRGNDREFIFYVKNTVWKGEYRLNDNFLRLTCLDSGLDGFSDAKTKLTDWTFEDDDDIGLVHIISEDDGDCDVIVEFYWDIDIVNG